MKILGDPVQNLADHAPNIYAPLSTCFVFTPNYGV
jgi:hypothetical protein